ncbi:hypothetical protein C1I95_17360 [Micromonospora craterilacus]|uniref:Uncharacterized protein n=1 Tax=Micromonospora craterilacus TaxID=1655439 RepID=A0A2W2DX48_9ACTN|nr:hypothetical protein [Micromonospora craterilacus]PZG16476.1 hypothetical protein C1I95_17360 [Micromonospora craterilacus]
MTALDAALATLTPEEAAKLDTMQASLRECRYVDIPDHRGLRPGARVYHSGHQWPGAAYDGTGVVLAVTERPDSPWSQTYRAPDVELIVLWDRPVLGSSSRLSQSASYRIHLAAVQQAADTGLDN